VAQLLDIANQDYRDVIVAGEYDAAMNHVSDLRVSFLIDGAEKFWVGEAAIWMAKRGFTLTAIETRPATAGPFSNPSDQWEGQSTFRSSEGKAMLTKRDRKWSIDGVDSFVVDREIAVQLQVEIAAF
jgi:hypothetical protein